MIAFHAFACLAALVPAPGHGTMAGRAYDTKTENVILVMPDGTRWHEVFEGAELDLMNKENGGVENVDGLKQRFWRDTPGQRREALMPFLWGTIAKNGQLLGNRNLQSESAVANPFKFSYPGYSETLSGFVDLWADSNDKRYNPNATVFEWLEHKPEFKGRTAAFGSWELYPWIFNAPRSHIYVNAGYSLADFGTKPSTALATANRLMSTIPLRGEETRPDAITALVSLEYVKAKHPRVLFIQYDYTDDECHDGRYDGYLTAIHNVDSYLKELWDTVQSMPQYRGKTTLIVCPDHGRGLAPRRWRDHGHDVPFSEQTWMAFLGPDTPALGERSNTTPVTESQIAATLAALLGYDYVADVPKAAHPIGDVVPQTARAGG